MKLRDFFKQFDEPKKGGNRGVLPDRGHAAPSVPAKKQPKVRIEFDDIANPTVWIDGKKLDAIKTMELTWITRGDKENEHSFEVKYLDTADLDGHFVKFGQTNMQDERDDSNNKADKLRMKVTVDTSQLVTSLERAKKDVAEAKATAIKNTGVHGGYRAEEFGVYARQIGKAFANSQMEPDAKAKIEANLLTDLMFIKGEIEKVAGVSRAIKFEGRYLKSDPSYLIEFLQTLGVNCHESVTTAYRKGKPYKHIKGLVVVFGYD